MLTLDTIYFSDSNQNNQPVLRLRIMDNNGSTLDGGFLTLHQKYRFQVSSNLAIGDDAGASPIIEYRKILSNLPREEVKDLLRGQVALAIEEWLRRKRNKLKIWHGVNEGVDTSSTFISTENSITGEKSDMDRFIDVCYDWIFN